MLTGLLRAIYAGLDYSITDVEQSAGAAIALSDDKVSVLMGRMRQPSLSIHGIEGAFSAPGGKTVIPAKVSGKFSIRYVEIWTSSQGTNNTLLPALFLPKRQTI